MSAQTASSPISSDPITLPDFLRVVHTVEELCSAVFPRHLLHQALNDPHHSTFFDSRAILTATKEQAAAVDECIYKSFPSNEPPVEYYSAFSPPEDGDLETQTMCTPEYMAECTGINFPPTVLWIRNGMPLVLMRDLGTHLRKGTRVIVVKHSRLVLDVRVVGATGPDQYALIPRLRFYSDPTREYPFTRRQFPVRPCFAMSIKRSQGEDLEHIGIDLRARPVLPGYPLMALSSVTDPKRICVLLPKEANRTVPNPPPGATKTK